jgi:hypothetical protein
MFIKNRLIDENFDEEKFITNFKKEEDCSKFGTDYSSMLYQRLKNSQHPLDNLIVNRIKQGLK